MDKAMVQPAQAAKTWVLWGCHQPTCESDCQAESRRRTKDGWLCAIYEAGAEPEGLRLQVVKRAGQSAAPPLTPVIYPCGCSRHKVRLGGCDIYGPDGQERPVKVVIDG